MDTRRTGSEVLLAGFIVIVIIIIVVVMIMAVLFGVLGLGRALLGGQLLADFFGAVFGAVLWLGFFLS